MTTNTNSIQESNILWRRFFYSMSRSPSPIVDTTLNQRRRQPTKWHRSRRKPLPGFEIYNDNNKISKINEKLPSEPYHCDNGYMQDNEQARLTEKLVIRSRREHNETTIERNNNNKSRSSPEVRGYLLNIHTILSAFLLAIIIMENVIVLNVQAKLVINVINTSGLSRLESATNRMRRAANLTKAINESPVQSSTTAKHSNPTPTSTTTTTTSKPKSAKLQQDVDALGYLERYGYMNKSSSNGNLLSEDSFEHAVMSFQRFAGIPETGTVDSMTIKYMQMPRCGNKDQSGKSEEGRRKRRKRYALQGSKWRRQELTYRISQYPTRFAYKKGEVDGQIEKAFKIWSQVAPIDFVVRKEGRVHIDIRFASGEHGDGDPFDGPGNTLAHAYFPQYGGDAHFDDQEYWTVDSYAGTNIFQVAAHELGHSLGLGHSSVREALMAPFYQKYKPNFKLHADDILAIQALYGERDGDSGGNQPAASSTTNKPPTSTSTTTTTTTVASRGVDDDDDEDGGGGFFGFGAGSGSKPVDLCQDSKIDAITRVEDGTTYVFRGQFYWHVKNDGLANNGIARKISRDWDGLPGNIDAALTWSDGKTFFFKGDKYWRFFNKRREPGYPKLISVGFAGIPNNVDAAFVWSGNGKTYFFKRDKYWRFDSKQEPPVSSQYPKSIKNWSGLPTSGIDGAFKWENGATYFFKDDLYYRFDDREFEVEASGRPPYPRSSAEWWFGCTNSNLPLIASSNSKPNKQNDINDEFSKSLLMFHRRPNLIYSSSDGDLSASANTDHQTTTNQERPRPAGNSISRSIINSLSGLFPSSSSSSSSDDHSSDDNHKNNNYNNYKNNDLDNDWQIHKGFAEDIRRLFVSARGASSDNSTDSNGSGSRGLTSTSLDNNSRARRLGSLGSSQPDTSRWLFPLSSSSSSRGGSTREQSLSELRMDPNLETTNDA